MEGSERGLPLPQGPRPRSDHPRNSAFNLSLSQSRWPLAPVLPSCIEMTRGNLGHLSLWTDPHLMPQTQQLKQSFVVESLSHVQLFCDPHGPKPAKVPLYPRDFPDKNWFWSWLPFPSSEALPDLGIELASPAVAGRFFTTEPPRKSPSNNNNSKYFWTAYSVQST